MTKIFLHFSQTQEASATVIVKIKCNNHNKKQTHIKSKRNKYTKANAIKIIGAKNKKQNKSSFDTKQQPSSKQKHEHQIIINITK